MPVLRCSQAFNPDLGEDAVQYSEAEKRANGRNVGAFTLKVIPSLLYSAGRCPTKPVEFNAGNVKHVQSHDTLLCSSVTIFPKTTASKLPEFKITMVNLSDPSSPAVVLTADHLQVYTGTMRGEDRMHHAGRGQRVTRAMTLPLSGKDDDSTNAWQGDSVTKAIGDGLTHFACGQTYTAIGRVTDLDHFCMTGLGKLYHFENGTMQRAKQSPYTWLHPDPSCASHVLSCVLCAPGAIVWHDEEFPKIIEQHCEALLWWEHNGYFDDEQLERYSTALALARTRKAELDRRRGAVRHLFEAAEARSDLYPA